ncbi:hypothetical protein [Staphylococcus epidermidis]|uniref:hypothetical protein n=1 Tax=Staphylococcus epidermidis TaxID=1282 RepID=UPI00119F9131|nr:hypothetical protein [Staphylococcus epidermidis]
MRNINEKVLGGMIKELGFIFNKVNMNKIKGKKGGKIEWLEFSFEGEKGIDKEGEGEISNIGKWGEYSNGEKRGKWLEEKIYKECEE